MRHARILLAVGMLASTAPGALADRPASPAQGRPPAATAQTPARISLMQTLDEWRYPGSEQLPGASMSDGGLPGVVSVKCQAVLTTPDPFEKVAAFCAQKTGAMPPHGRDPKAEPRSVTDQDDSQGRPLKLHVFTVNTSDTSTTLVISRAVGEERTHVAWTHFFRLRLNP